ncbi:acylsugar acyltransferase 3-like protein [Tanacetum coccineum]
MTIVSNLVRFGRRQLHTIVSSREIIKPSSPTPSHLKAHNLSLIDRTTMSSFMPIISFYPNTGDSGSAGEKTLALKKSLSQALTKYYPFAGRHAKLAPSCVDCNDEGAVFHEASVDSTLSDFLQNSQNKDLDHFFPSIILNVEE